jgi:hypothetical protein
MKTRAIRMAKAVPTTEAAKAASEGAFNWQHVFVALENIHSIEVGTVDNVLPNKRWLLTLKCRVARSI